MLEVEERSREWREKSGRGKENGEGRAREAINRVIVRLMAVCCEVKATTSGGRLWKGKELGGDILGERPK
jgi:hypothetical protein